METVSLHCWFLYLRCVVLFRRRKENAMEAVFPCELLVLPEYVFNKKDPLILGMKVNQGVLRIGTPLSVPEKGVRLPTRFVTLCCCHRHPREWSTDRRSRNRHSETNRVCMSFLLFFLPFFLFFCFCSCYRELPLFFKAPSSHLHCCHLQQLPFLPFTARSSATQRKPSLEGFCCRRCGTFFYTCVSLPLPPSLFVPHDSFAAVVVAVVVVVAVAFVVFVVAVAFVVFVVFVVAVAFVVFLSLLLLLFLSLLL